MANKGFGGAKSGSSQSAKQFILKFQKYWEANPDLKKAHQFFSSHLSELNESLLSALPHIFRELTKNKKPQEKLQIASLFWLFGTSIQLFSLQDRSLNIEFSLNTFQIALKIFTRKDFPEKWAMMQNSLGTTYCQRLRGDLADNLEKAIAAYELALLVRTCEAFPENWAATQNNLGVAYRERILGERANNLEKAIAAYELALQVRNRETLPANWAETQNNLGVAYRDRIRGERIDNIEQAIIAFELALQISTRSSSPTDWALIQNNLGLAYRDRIQGERANNLEKSINTYNLALQVRTRESAPEKWAMTQHNLATAYRERILGERDDNLEQAIYLYNQAAQVFTRNSLPQKWAYNQAELAEALMKRALLKNSFTDLDTTINLLQTSLEVAITGSPNFIDTQYRLGNSLSHRYEHSQNADDLQQAMQAYKIALDAISPEHYDRKQIWQALPTTQVILGSRLVSDGQWQEGLQLLLNSLTQLSTDGDPLAHANALYQTGRAYEVMGDLDKARTYYRDALRLYEHLKDQLGTTQSRAGLGSVLVSQGYLEKGLNELEKVRDGDGYLLLPKDTQTEFDNIYQAAKRALERSNNEVYV